MMKKWSTWAAAGLLLASSLGMAQTPYSEDSTYRGLGGKEGIDKIVASFLALVQQDVRVKESFVDFDMEQLAGRLAEQFCEFSGGPCKYTGKYKDRDMESSHVDLKITNAQFNAVTEDLQLAMERHGVPNSVQNKLIAKLAPMQRAIVTK
ncbi:MULTISPECIES: group I truncated hemoglobin [unclassified Janthinobacterium]|uniref:group I truncated hemoglobin n=1 Tax=unclassified Janthinobacterium TaxID=2610881 RepID=UPI0003458319|nr:MULTISPECIES: group 1 truncated hemoglobin [unclassified Janthinobacterium]MEC5160101.1 hemoglobin [Janthinobacterium sp. CG_S6]